MALTPAPGAFTPFAPPQTGASSPTGSCDDKPALPLPMTRREMLDRGWDAVDVVFVTGDAYVDHPSFAMAILGRVLEAYGYRVAILSQPDWRSCDPWKTFGRPRLLFAVNAGNMDSMINHYTANRKVRNDDAYSPGGRTGLRPDRATLAYCQRAREAYKEVPIIAGGIEASLRRLAHYDYWSDTVKRSILLDAKADLLVFGMGESAIVEIAERLQDGETLKNLRNMRGVAYVTGASEVAPSGNDVVELPSFEKVKTDKQAFAVATRLIHRETNPFSARALVQYHDRQAVVCNPPRLPELQQAMDFFYDLPFTRKPHPSYKEPIPAFFIVKDSVTIMRGCFGGCAFCSITTHQGRIVQSRSKQSIMAEVAAIGADGDSHGIVSDIGGPTTNLYRMRCKQPEVEARCRRLSCLHPKICRLLNTDHQPLIDVMRSARKQKGVRKVLVASGLRMDVARLSPAYIEELTAHHVGGHLTVAPEHCDPHTLKLMRKPGIENFQAFAEQFKTMSRQAGKEQYLMLYLIAGHPGCDLRAVINLAVFLKRSGYTPQQVQDFIPAPFDVASCMYHTGLDPMTMEPVFVAKGLRDRKTQRALMQFFKPENYFAIHKALIEAGRTDLIGDGCDALIPENPPQAALIAGRKRTTRQTALSDDPENARRNSNAGYRPGRSSAKRRRRRPPPAV